MKNASKEQLEAMARMEHSRDFILFQMWLQENLISTRETNDIQRDDVNLRMGQGEAQALSIILKTISTAADLVRTASARRGEQGGTPAYTPTP